MISGKHGRGFDENPIEMPPHKRQRQIKYDMSDSVVLTGIVESAPNSESGQNIGSEIENGIENTIGMSTFGELSENDGISNNGGSNNNDNSFFSFGSGFGGLNSSPPPPPLMQAMGFGLECDIKSILNEF